MRVRNFQLRYRPAAGKREVIGGNQWSVAPFRHVPTGEKTFGSAATGDMKIKFDWITALLIVGLIATLIAFFTGVFPYPYGWLVVSALLLSRLAFAPGKE